MGAKPPIKNEHPNKRTVSACLAVLFIKHVILKEEGDVLTIGETIRNQQPDVYQKLIKLCKKKKIIEEKIDFKRLMEEAPVYKRHHGAWRQVRNG